MFEADIPFGLYLRAAYSVYIRCSMRPFENARFNNFHYHHHHHFFVLVSFCVPKMFSRDCLHIILQCLVLNNERVFRFSHLFSFIYQIYMSIEHIEHPSCDTFSRTNRSQQYINCSRSENRFGCYC